MGLIALRTNEGRERARKSGVIPVKRRLHALLVTVPPTTAVETFVSIMTDPKAPPAARVSAANALLDRGYGKLPQHVTGERGSDFIRFIKAPEDLSNEHWQKKYGQRSAAAQRFGETRKLSEGESTFMGSVASPGRPPRLHSMQPVSRSPGCGPSNGHVRFETIPTSPRDQTEASEEEREGWRLGDVADKNSRAALTSYLGEKRHSYRGSVYGIQLVSSLAGASGFGPTPLLVGTERQTRCPPESSRPMP